jgi:hypothetical protein
MGSVRYGPSHSRPIQLLPYGTLRGFPTTAVPRPLRDLTDRRYLPGLEVPSDRIPQIRHRVDDLHREELSLSAIAAQINAEGLRTSAGTEWTKAGVQRLVSSLKLNFEALAKHLPADSA